MLLCYFLLSFGPWFESVMNGPPGQMIAALCFHPDTQIKIKTNKIVKMKDLKLGEILKNGQIVQATMNIHNLDKNNNCIEKLYLIPNGENNSSILVTGSHLIFDKSKMKFIFVKDLSESKESDIKTDTLVCLITSDHTIPLGNYIFHDWEDNQDIYQNIN